MELLDRCPCCGQPVPQNTLTWNRQEGTLAGRGAAVSFGPVTAAIFDCLWRAKGRALGVQAIVARVYAHDIEGGPLTARNAVAVAIFKLREVLPQFGLTITTRIGPGAVYRLLPLAEATRAEADLDTPDEAEAA